MNTFLFVQMNEKYNQSNKTKVSHQKKKKKDNSKLPSTF